MSRQTKVKSAGKVKAGAKQSSNLAAEAGKHPNGKFRYFDPFGRRGQAVDYRQKMYDDGGFDEVFGEINRLHIEKNYSLRDAVKEAKQKSFGTGDVQLPVFVTDLVISQAESTPVSDTLARVGVDETTVNLDNVSNVSEAGSFDEGGNLPDADDTVDQYTYPIYEYGAKREVTDKVEFATSQGIGYSSMDHKTQVLSEAMAQYEERQAIQGTNFDVNGFEGLADWVDPANVSDAAGANASIDFVRDVITELRKATVPYGSMMVVTDHQSFRELKDSIDDAHRKELTSDVLDINFGLQVLDVDGVAVAESHGSPSADGDRQILGFNAGTTYWAELSGQTFKPLVPPSDTSEAIGVYNYASLVTHTQNHIAVVENIGTPPV